MPLRLRGDPARLRQILLNLGGNAVKFTGNGEVIVRASLDGKDERNEHSAVICISVEDTGIGIPADRQSDIFSPFTQVDGSTTRKYGGTGLGLAISSRLVELMGGKIGVESEPGKGSTFWITAAFEKQPAESPAPLMDPTDLLKNARILVVDDDEPGRREVSVLLRGLGCRPAEAVDAQSALALLAGRGSAGRPIPGSTHRFHSGVDGRRDARPPHTG